MLAIIKKFVILVRCFCSFVVRVSEVQATACGRPTILLPDKLRTIVLF